MLQQLTAEGKLSYEAYGVRNLESFQGLQPDGVLYFHLFSTHLLGAPPTWICEVDFNPFISMELALYSSSPTSMEEFFILLQHLLSQLWLTLLSSLLSLMDNYTLHVTYRSTELSRRVIPALLFLDKQGCFNSSPRGSYGIFPPL